MSLFGKESRVVVIVVIHFWIHVFLMEVKQNFYSVLLSQKLIISFTGKAIHLIWFL